MPRKAGRHSRYRRPGALALLAVTSLALSACAASQERPSSAGRLAASGEGVSGSLVLAPDPGISRDSTGDRWEQGRNDASLGIAARPPSLAWRWVEVRQRDRRWTSGGRPGEYSSTTTRTLETGTLRGR